MGPAQKTSLQQIEMKQVIRELWERGKRKEGMGDEGAEMVRSNSLERTSADMLCEHLDSDNKKELEEAWKMEKAVSTCIV